jgi:hypothetical protein
VQRETLTVEQISPCCLEGFSAGVGEVKPNSSFNWRRVGSTVTASIPYGNLKCSPGSTVIKNLPKRSTTFPTRLSPEGATSYGENRFRTFEPDRVHIPRPFRAKRLFRPTQGKPWAEFSCTVSALGNLRRRWEILARRPRRSRRILVIVAQSLIPLLSRASPPSIEQQK